MTGETERSAIIERDQGFCDGVDAALDILEQNRNVPVDVWNAVVALLDRFEADR